ncbi:hypothetical protein [Streptomyces lavendofoliae]|uniref:hypothetical protein n=1 Tax=Streptomyces lavendofoliae TaxID=67314 RepID=UPI003D94CB29
MPTTSLACALSSIAASLLSPCSRVNLVSVSVPAVVVSVRPRVVWWNQVSPSLVRSLLSVPAWTASRAVPEMVMVFSWLWSLQVWEERARPAPGAAD